MSNYLEKIYGITKKYWRYGDVRQYCREKLDDLENDHTGPYAEGLRWRNVTVAKYLFKLPKLYPNSLKAIKHIDFLADNISSSREFFDAWKDRCVDKTLPNAFSKLITQ